MSQTQPTYEVHLAIYDLSGGMARSLSGQFLGSAHAIDIIPHTGIVVHGLEYFYGGGIQSADPNEFRRSKQIFPIEVQSLGRTSASKDEFDQWCLNAMRTGQYSAEAYDLLNRNCNNFSHDAALQGLRLSRGVPDWILQVPQRFLSSPMGQMVRPMLEQMQVTSGGSSAAPFANASAASPVATAPTPSISADSNPWANISGRPESSDLNNDKEAELVTSNASSEPVSTPVLDAHNRPLLSNDTKVVGVCVSKLSKSVYNEADKSSLEQLSLALTAGTKPPEKVVDACSRALLQILNGGGSNVVFALMLLRLVVLHPPKTVDDESAFGRCLAWVGEHVRSSDVLSAPARSMAWCTLSNAYRMIPSSLIPLDDIVEAAMMDLSPESQPRSEVRQSAAAFLYNVAHQQSPLADPTSEELPDLLVSLLCGSLDGIVEDPDATTRLRRLLVAGRIVRPGSSETVVNNAAAKSLVMDLGFTEAISVLSSQENVNSGDADKVKNLAAELQMLVEN